MIRKFYEYWTESGEKQTKLRFEKEKVFDHSLRLVTWNSRNENNKRGAGVSKGVGKMENAFNSGEEAKNILRNLPE